MRSCKVEGLRECSRTGSTISDRTPPSRRTDLPRFPRITYSALDLVVSPVPVCQSDSARMQSPPNLRLSLTHVNATVDGAKPRAARIGRCAPARKGAGIHRNSPQSRPATGLTGTAWISSKVMRE
jgi:hypothetical protein